MKLGSQEIQGIAKDRGQKILFHVSIVKNGEWLNENLSQETFLATTLGIALWK